LYARGTLPEEVSEADVDTCLSNSQNGAEGLWWCLIESGQINEPQFLWASHPVECVENHGSDAQVLGRCLSSQNLIPSTVTTENIQSCLSTVETEEITRCLRINNHVSSVMMGPHTVRCSEAGQDAMNIHRCLDNNGLLPVDVAGAPLTEIDIVAIDNCLLAQGNDPALVPGCLRGQALLPDSNPNIRPTNEHFVFCEQVVGSDNIEACLNTNNLLLGDLNQTQISSCLSVAGISTANITNCLESRGILPNFAALKDYAGEPNQPLRNCVGCHNDVTMVGGFSVDDYADLVVATNAAGEAIIVPGDPAASRAFIRMNDDAAPMPPSGLLPQEQRDRMELWIERGALENY